MQATLSAIARHPPWRRRSAASWRATRWPSSGGRAPGLRILLDNLIENAARHGREDGTVRVTLRPAVNGDGPAIEVEDDGPGIPTAERERVFEPFHRVAGSDRPVSGLGLALVAQQARLHGADVSVGDSALGGARVRVGFPAAQDP